MSSRLTALPRVLVLAGLVALIALTGPSAAQAETSWGDAGHFGESEGELRNPEAAFGINPSDGSLWTVDVVNVTHGSEIVEELRLQKFEKVSGSWKAVASASLGPVETASEDEREAEGVAFDAAKERAYILITAIGPKTAKGEADASELLAFSTKTSGSTISPASGTKTGGVLVPTTTSKLTGSPVGKSEFGPDSTEKGAALILPGGVGVNPANHQIILTGWIGGEIPVVWAISETGTIQAVWEDKSNFFEKCGCLSSPVVTPGGKLLVLGETEEESGVYELPAELTSSPAPKRVFWLPQSKFECEVLQREKEEGKKVELCPFVEGVATIQTGNNQGGEMSVGPKGELFVHVQVRNVGEGGFEAGAVMVLNPSFEEIGWTGGGSWSTGTKECAVNESNPGNLGPALIAGAEGQAFMLERGDPSLHEHAKVLALGTGGATSNCPPGSAAKPQAEAGGAKGTSFPIADKIVFSSAITQANALSSEWEFEPGVKQAVATRQQQTTKVEHQFTKEGTFTIGEKINTDDLATPQLETSEKITVVAPKIREEAASAEPTIVTLKAEVNPSKSPTKCEFQVVKTSEEFGAAGMKTAPCATGPGEEEKWVAETVKITGLTQETHYKFRLLTKAGLWQSGQPGAEFVTPAPGAPVVETAAATSVSSTGATLNGTVNPKGKETKSCVFEYGTSLPSGKTVPCTPTPGKGETPIVVFAAVTGLTAATSYEYQLLDESSEGKKGEGGKKSFKTGESAQPPLAETLSASPTQTTATLHGSVNPRGEATTCHFELGTSTSYGTSIPCATAPGEGHLSVAESVTAGGLTPGTTYHYRIVAESKLGPAFGADKEFTTSPGEGGGCTSACGGETPKETPKEGTKGVEHETVVPPVVTVSGTSLSVAGSGAFTIKLSCPGEAKECAGTITIKTLSAVAARSAFAAKAKKAILTLATGSFKIAGGKLVTVTLHLSAKAKKYLAKVHTIRAKATISARNPQGATHVGTAVLTLKAAKKKH